MSWRTRRGGNPDQNNQAIADTARRFGVQVVMTTGVGFDFPDQVWGFGRDQASGIPGVTILVEVTNPNTKGKAQRERKARQQRFRDSWPGGLVVELMTPDDVVTVLTGPQVRQLQKEQAVRCGYLHENGKPNRPVAVPSAPQPGP
jgi:hypothetical protein